MKILLLNYYTLYSLVPMGGGMRDSQLDFQFWSIVSFDGQTIMLFVHSI